MKVLLLEHPRSIKLDNINDIANAPLSSSLFTGYVAGMLTKDHHVKIIEGYLEKMDFETIYQKILEFKPDVIGVHLIYQWKTDEKLYRFLERIKEDKATSYICSYGYYANFTYEELLNECSAVDVVVLGEPEKPFLDFIESTDKQNSYKEIQGLAYRKESGEIRFTYGRPYKNLDELPFPIRTPASYSIGEVNIMGSRGCYGGCTFCYINPFIGDGIAWRGRSPENIIEEIDSIIDTTQMKCFYFTDPNFFGPGEKGQQRVLKLAELLKIRNITFGIEARVNDINEKTIKSLVDAGLRHILIGLESGRQETLDRLNKMTTVEENERAISILRKYGIEPNVGFIMFEPDSSIRDLRENFEFLQRNKLLHSLDITVNVLYHHQIILKGSKAYHMLQNNNRLKLSPYSSYEGSAAYQNIEVRNFAFIMREVTNCVFDEMEKIWSKNLSNHFKIKKQSQVVNIMLVDLFEEVLCYIENGNTIDSIYRDKKIRTIQNDIIKQYRIEIR